MKFQIPTVLTRTFAGVAMVVTVAFLSPVSAHDDKTPVHFVTEHGTDLGDCSMPEQPCATIDYAFRKVGKSDEIRVGAGVYAFRSYDPAEIISLLSPIITVRGGFTAKDKFEVRNDTANPTVLVTSPSNERYVTHLQANGFVVRPIFKCEQ